jgi:predicted ATPase
MGHVRTPDRRLRVFVSSTLGELAEERRAVSRALSALRLTAVMFEAGARPQPPGEVYRAYLAQSDVFIGLYWQQYGQLVPGLEISGLEEELLLAQGMPRLLYLKTPAPARDPRLDEMFGRVREEASYRRFRTPAELGRLVRDDVAQLLSERFAASTSASPTRQASVSAAATATVPVGTTSLVGRESAIDDVAGLLARPEPRLITLTGPSGIGKTRLALAVAERLRQSFDGGGVFVPLEDVTDPGDVLPRIGWALGSDVTGPSPVAALSRVLDRDRWLLVLDNLDRLTASGPDLAELLSRCPGACLLATSTTVLGVRAEHTYPVPPLPVPAEPDSIGPAEVLLSPAVRLFTDRARAVRPGFELTADHVLPVVEICRRLDGVPLAIELAAARVRLLDPAAVLSRLSRSLDALGTGMVDLPDRHQTLRATVEWSVDLLGPDERSMLEVLAVFCDTWTVKAAAHVGGLDDDRTLELIESLARHSLVHVTWTPGGPRARMLNTVREYVTEWLLARPDADDVHRRHAEYFRAVAESADGPLRGFRQRSCAALLVSDQENIGAAVRWHLVHDRGPLPGLFRVLGPYRILWPFLGVGDMIIGEARSWVAELLPEVDELPPADRIVVLGAALVSALERGDAGAARATRARMVPLLDEIGDPYVAAVSTLLMAWGSALVRDVDGAHRGLIAALERLRSLDEPMWTALALVSVGPVEMALGHHEDGLRHVMEAQWLAGRFDAPWLDAVSRVTRAGFAVAREDFERARELLEQGLELSLSGRSVHCLCMVLDGAATLSLAQGDHEQAGLLIGAAGGLRRRSGLLVYSGLRGDGDLAAAVRDATGALRFDQLAARGARFRESEVPALVRDSLALSAATPHGAALET